jgi:glycosyltransferase involved in cell wall biosynthesis
MAATIHDLTPFLYPRTFPQIVGLYLRISLRSIAHRAKIISVPSESTKRDLIRILGVEEKRIKVIYPSLVPVEVKIRPEVNPVKLEKYILAVGTNEPRKNLKGLIEAYSKLAPEMRREYPLVIAGRSGWKTVVFDKLLEEKGLTEEVLFTGFVEEEMLAHLYRNASVFCYVSLYEGFGYPPLEAMYYGAPVLVSNIASLPEVVGDAGMLVDPRSTEAIARGLEQLLTSERLRQKLRNEGRVQAQKFIKNGFAEKTLEMFDQNT